MNSHVLAEKKSKKARSKVKPAPVEEEEEQPKEEIHASLTVTIRLTEDALTRVDPSKLEKEAEAKQTIQKSTAVFSICTRPSLTTAAPESGRSQPPSDPLPRCCLTCLHTASVLLRMQATAGRVRKLNSALWVEHGAVIRPH